MVVNESAPTNNERGISTGIYCSTIGESIVAAKKAVRNIKKRFKGFDNSTKITRLLRKILLAMKNVDFLKKSKSPHPPSPYFQ